METVMPSGGMTMTTSSIPCWHERPALRRALESAGFLVFDCSDDGRERERLRELWAALILHDLPMPRLWGLEVVRRLQDGGETPEAIILTHGGSLEATATVRFGTIDMRARTLAPKAVRAAVEETLRPASGARPGPALPRILVAVEAFVLELLRAKRALDRREFDDAERWLRRAIERYPDSAAAHNLKGVLHQRRGESHASYRAFKAALKVDPDYEPALENLKHHCRRFGLDFRRSSRRATGRGDQPGTVGHSNEQVDITQPTSRCDRSAEFVGPGLGAQPSPRPSRK
jgi:DNA-binding response OmpR family regulator